MSRTSLLLLFAALSAGCAPKAYVRAMNAASVDIPTSVQRVAVVDRSRPKNVGQTVLGALEGAVTGEMPLEDNEARDKAVQALVATLEAAPRFEVLRPVVTSKEVDSNLMDTPWDHKAVAKLCEEHGCDAVISLETFDTDATVTMGKLEVPEPEPETTEPAPTSGGSSKTVTDGSVTKGEGSGSRDGATSAKDGSGSRDGATTQPAPESAPETTETASESSDEPPPPTHWAQRSTRLSATWRMYDASADRKLDEQRDRVIGSKTRAEAYSTEEAIAKLVSASSLVNADGAQLGREYGVRISPTWVGLERVYYGSGALKQGKIHIKAGDWDGARDIFKAIVDDPSTGAKTRGKARHNLALCAEVEGKLKKAHKLAQKAAIELNNEKSRRYARSLERRMEEQAKVEAQLAPPEETE